MRLDSVCVNLFRHDLNISALAACGGLTEWLRSLIGNQVRRNSPVGSSPMSSANITRTVELSTVLLFVHELYTNFIQYRQSFIFFLGVEVAICVECLLYITMPEPTAYLENINSIIG